jgi:hypothetical protein
MISIRWCLPASDSGADHRDRDQPVIIERTEAAEWQGLAFCRSGYRGGTWSPERSSADVVMVGIRCAGRRFRAAVLARR